MKPKPLFFLIMLLLATCHITLDAGEGKSAAARPLSFTISGGVSLGSYQGGYAYYASRVLKEQSIYQVVQVTGASAGSINSFLLAASLCLDSVPKPEKSLFYKAWINIGIKQLKYGKNLGPIGLFTQENIRDTAKSLLDEIWNTRPSSPCSVLVGITVTRKDVKKYFFTPEFAVPHQEEKISFMLKFDEAWSIRPVLVRGKAGPRLILGFGKGRHEDKKILLDLLMASSAFPGAFPPQKLVLANADSAAMRNCGEDLKTNLVFNLWDSVSSCNSSLLDSSDFLDGGVFENRPLRLAYNLSKTRIENRKGATDSMFFIYLDQDNKKYPIAYPASVKDTVSTFFSNLTGFSSSFVESARNKELFSLFEEMHSSPGHLLLTSNRIPPLSEGLSAFAGFFDKDFRRFDFYLGMYDAFRDIKLRFGTEVNGNDSNFDCIKEFFQIPHAGKSDSDSEIESCKNMDGNLKLLMKGSLERLERSCAYYEMAKKPLVNKNNHSLNKYIKSSTPPSPVLDSVCREYLPVKKMVIISELFYSQMNYLETLGLSQFSLSYAEQISFGDLNFLQMVNGLQARGYTFLELGNGAPLMKIKAELLDIVGNAASRQPPGSKLKFSIVGKHFANSFMYNGPPSTWYLSGGQSGFNLGYNAVFFGNSFNFLLYLISDQTFSFQLGDFSRDQTNVAALYGVNFLHLLKFLPIQLKIGWETGYAIDVEDTHQHGFRSQFPITLSIYDRIRIQLLFTSIAKARPSMHDCKINVLMGYQFF